MDLFVRLQLTSKLGNKLIQYIHNKKEISSQEVLSYLKVLEMKQQVKQVRKVFKDVMCCIITDNKLALDLYRDLERDFQEYNSSSDNDRYQISEKIIEYFGIKSEGDWLGPVGRGEIDGVKPKENEIV